MRELREIGEGMKMRVAKKVAEGLADGTLDSKSLKELRGLIRDAEEGKILRAAKKYNELLGGLDTEIGERLSRVLRSLGRDDEASKILKMTKFKYISMAFRRITDKFQQRVFERRVEFFSDVGTATAFTS